MEVLYIFYNIRPFVPLIILVILAGDGPDLRFAVQLPNIEAGHYQIEAAININWCSDNIGDTNMHLMKGDYQNEKIEDFILVPEDRYIEYDFAVVQYEPADDGELEHSLCLSFRNKFIRTFSVKILQKMTKSYICGHLVEFFRPLGEPETKTYFWPKHFISSLSLRQCLRTVLHVVSFLTLILRGD